MNSKVLKFERKTIESVADVNRRKRIDYLKSSIDVFDQVGRHDLMRVAQEELKMQIEIQVLMRSF